jgi:hypothetical protein
MKRSHSSRRTLQFLLTMVIGLTGLSCAKAVPEDRLNLACVTRLQLPFYPPIAQSAAVGLRMTVAIVLADGGAPQSIAYEDISGTMPDARLFFPEIERAVKGSQFAPTCSGKTVRFTFAFRLDRDPPKAIWFETPNRFEIAAAEPFIVNRGSK